MRSFSIYFFVAFVAIGAYASWLAPFLDFCGVSASAIGYSFAVVSLCRAVTPPLWGLLADHTGRQPLLLALVTLGCGVSLVPLFLGGPPWLLLAGTLGFGIFLAPLYPLLDAQVLASLGPARAGYGRIRLYGSVGFLFANLAIGPLIAKAGFTVVPWVIVIPLIAAAVIASAFPANAVSHPARPAVREPGRMPWRTLLPILVAVILVQASHSPYWAYYATFLGELEVSPAIVGLMLATAVAAEIVLMAGAPPLMRRWGAPRVLFVGLALAAARWLICGTTTELWLQWPSQLLHAGSYAMVYVATVVLVDEASPPGRRAFGQTLLSACSHGVGLGGGFLLAGALVDVLQFPGLALLGAGACLAGATLLKLTEPLTAAVGSELDAATVSRR